MFQDFKKNEEKTDVAQEGLDSDLENQPKGETSEASVAQEIEPKSDVQDEQSEWEKKYTYLYAEFENFKKHVFKEKAQQRKYGHQAFAKELLNALDSLEKSKEVTKDKTFRRGIDLILKQFHQAFEKFGVVKIKSINQKFDADIHESLSTVPSETPGIVVNEIRSGYKIYDFVLRPSQVVVGSEK